MQKKISHICFGDIVYIEINPESVDSQDQQSNFTKTKKVVLCSNGFYNPEVNFISDANLAAKSFRNCLFMVLPAINVVEKAQAKQNDKKFQRIFTTALSQIDAQNLQSILDQEEDGQAPNEEQTNDKDKERKEESISIQEIFNDVKNKPILQAQKVQFFSIESQKFLKVNKQAHAGETELHSLSLSEKCSAATAFIVLDNPLERENEYVNYNKDIELISCLNNQSIVCGSSSTKISKQAADKNQQEFEAKSNSFNCFQINIPDHRNEPIADSREIYFAGTRAVFDQSFLIIRNFVSWKSYENVKSTQMIRNGDYVRIKNSNSYLMLSDINNFTQPLFSFNLLQNYEYHNINTIFQIIEAKSELDNLQKGDLAVGMNSTDVKGKQYFLKHLISGKLLKIPEARRAEVLKQDEAENEYKYDPHNDARLSFIINQKSTHIREIPLTYGKEIAIVSNTPSGLVYIHNKNKKIFDFTQKEEIENEFYKGPKTPLERFYQIAGAQFTEMDTALSGEDHQSVFRMKFEKVGDFEIHRVLDFESFSNLLKKFTSLLKSGISKNDTFTKELARFKKLARKFHESFTKTLHIEVSPEKINLDRNTDDILVREFNLFDHILNILILAFSNPELIKFFKNVINDDGQDNNHENHKIWKIAFPEIIIDLLEIFYTVTEGSEANAHYCSIYLRKLIKIVMEDNVPFLDEIKSDKETIKGWCLDIISVILIENNYNALDYIVPESILSLEEDKPFTPEHLFILEKIACIKTPLNLNPIMVKFMNMLEDEKFLIKLFPEITFTGHLYNIIFKNKNNKVEVISEIVLENPKQNHINYYSYFACLFKLINSILAKKIPKFFNIIKNHYTVEKLLGLLKQTKDLKMKILMTHVLFNYYMNNNEQYWKPFVDKWNIYTDKPLEINFGTERIEYLDLICQIIKDKSHLQSLIVSPPSQAPTKKKTRKSVTINEYAIANSEIDQKAGSTSKVMMIASHLNEIELIELFETILRTPNYYCGDSVMLMMYRRCMEILDTPGDSIKKTHLSPKMINKAVNIAISCEDKIMQARAIILGQKIYKKWGKNDQKLLENSEIKDMINDDVIELSHKKIDLLGPYDAKIIQEVLTKHFLREDFANFDAILKKLMKSTNTEKEFIHNMVNGIFISPKEEDEDMNALHEFFRLARLIDKNYQNLIGIVGDLDDLEIKFSPDAYEVDEYTKFNGNSKGKKIELTTLSPDKKSSNKKPSKYDNLRTENSTQKVCEQLLILFDDLFSFIYNEKLHSTGLPKNTISSNIPNIIKLSDEAKWAPFYIKQLAINTNNQKIFTKLGMTRILMNIIKIFSFPSDNPIYNERNGELLTGKILKSATILLRILYYDDEAHSALQANDIQNDLLDLIIGISRQQITDKSVIFMMTQFAAQKKLEEKGRSQLEFLYYKYSFILIKGENISKEIMCFLAFGLDFILKSEQIEKYSKMIAKLLDVLVFNILQWEDFDLKSLMNQPLSKIEKKSAYSVPDSYYCLYSIFESLLNASSSIADTELSKRLSHFSWRDLLRHKNLLFQFELRSLIAQVILALFLEESTGLFLSSYEEYISFFSVIFWDICLFLEFNNNRKGRNNDDNNSSANKNELIEELSWLRKILSKNHIVYKSQSEYYQKIKDSLQNDMLYISNITFHIDYRDLNIMVHWNSYIYKSLIKTLMNMIKVKQENTIRKLYIDEISNKYSTYFIMQIRLINILFEVQECDDPELRHELYNFFVQLKDIKIYNDNGGIIGENMKSYLSLRSPKPEKANPEGKPANTNFNVFLHDFVKKHYKVMQGFEIDSISLMIYQSKDFTKIVKKLIAYLNLEFAHRPSTNIVVRILHRIVELVNVTQKNDKEDIKDIYEWDEIDPIIMKRIERVQILYQKYGLTKVIFKMLLQIKNTSDMFEILYLALTYLFGGPLRIQQEFYNMFLSFKDNKIIQLLASEIRQGFERIVNQGRYLIHNPESSKKGSSTFDLLYERNLNILVSFIQYLCEDQFDPFQRFFHNQEADGEKFENSFNFLQFIQNLCQNYSSFFHIRNIDLGVEMIEMLKYLTDGIHQNIDTIINRTFVSQITSLLVLSTHHKFHIERGLVAIEGADENDKKERFDIMKNRIVIIIKIMTENATDDQKLMMKQFLDIKGLLKVFHSTMKEFIISKHKLMKRPKNPLTPDEEQKIFNYYTENLDEIIKALSNDDFGIILMTAINIFIAIRNLFNEDHEFSDAIKEVVDDMKVNEGEEISEQIANLMFKFAKKIIRSIELILKDIDDNRLLRVWFPELVTCRFIYNDSKEAFLENVDRSNAQTKLSALLKISNQFIPQMLEEYQLRNIFKGFNYVKIYNNIRTFSNIIAITINIINVVTLIDPNASPGWATETETENKIEYYQDPSAQKAVFAFNIIQMILSILLLVLRIVFFRVRRIGVNWIRYCEQMGSELGPLPKSIEAKLYEGVTDLTTEECITVLKLRGPYSYDFKVIEGLPPLYNTRVRTLRWLYTLKFIFFSYNLIWNGLYVAICVVSFTHPAYNSFQTFDIAVRSNTVKRIIESITKNRVAFLWTLYLLFVVVLIYTFFGFYYLNGYLVDHDAGPLCKDAFQCFLIVLDYGVKSDGGIGDMLAKPTYYREDNMWGILGPVFYNLSFYTIATAILLNLIFGMIIDSFGEIRDKKRENEENESNVCFVCDKARGDYQRYGDFTLHIEKEHNVWNYLFYIVYLKERLKNKTELTSIESYVIQKLDISSTEWFPIDRSLTVDSFMKDEETEEGKDLMKMKNLINEMGKEVTKISKLKSEIQKINVDDENIEEEDKHIDLNTEPNL